MKRQDIWNWWFIASILIIIITLTTSCSEPAKEWEVNEFKRNINEIHAAMYTEESLEDIYSKLEIIKNDVIGSYPNRKVIKEIFGDKSQVFIDQYTQTWSLYNDWYNKIGTLKEDISNYKSWIKSANKDNLYLSYIKARRFDTGRDGRGWYEAYSTGMYQKVVIISEPEKVVINSIYPNEVYVKDAGQNEMIVKHTNAFRSWNTKEYYNTYKTVGDLSNPSYLKDKLAEAIAHLAKNKSQFTTSKNELLFQAELLNGIINRANRNK